MQRNDECRREEMMFLALAAEKAERFAEMAGFLRDIAGDSRPISKEEANLLRLAYKNLINSRRAALRVIENSQKVEENKGNIKKLQLLLAFQEKIKEEIAGFCKEIIEVLEKQLVNSAENSEIWAFYLKISGDFYRYFAEILEEGSETKEKILEKMKKNQEKSEEFLNKFVHPCDPTKLGLALSSAVFYYEVLNDRGKACFIAKKAFDEAIVKIDEIKEEDYKDSTTSLQMLRDYIFLWEN